MPGTVGEDLELLIEEEAPLESIALFAEMLPPELEGDKPPGGDEVLGMLPEEEASPPEETVSERFFFRSLSNTVCKILGSLLPLAALWTANGVGRWLRRCSSWSR